MSRLSVRQRRRWSLSLIAVLLLHWTFGICAAMADVICIEADGRVMLEHQGESCHDKAGHASAKPCIDLAAGDHDDAHDSLPSSHVPVATLPPLFLVPALAQPDLMAEPLVRTVAFVTGPPLAVRRVSLRESTVLLI